MMRNLWLPLIVASLLAAAPVRGESWGRGIPSTRIPNALVSRGAENADAIGGGPAAGAPVAQAPMASPAQAPIDHYPFVDRCCSSAPNCCGDVWSSYARECGWRLHGCRSHCGTSCGSGCGLWGGLGGCLNSFAGSSGCFGGGGGCGSCSKHCGTRCGWSWPRLGLLPRICDTNCSLGCSSCGVTSGEPGGCSTCGGQHAHSEHHHGHLQAPQGPQQAPGVPKAPVVPPPVVEPTPAKDAAPAPAEKSAFRPALPGFLFRGGF